MQPWNRSLTAVASKSCPRSTNVSNAALTASSSLSSFACLQLDAGTSIAVVQRYLGHKNVATTEVYAKISDAQKRASVGCITLKK